MRCKMQLMPLCKYFTSFIQSRIFRFCASGGQNCKCRRRRKPQHGLLHVRAIRNVRIGRKETEGVVCRQMQKDSAVWSTVLTLPYCCTHIPSVFFFLNPMLYYSLYCNCRYFKVALFRLDGRGQACNPVQVNKWNLINPTNFGRSQMKWIKYYLSLHGLMTCIYVWPNESITSTYY